MRSMFLGVVTITKLFFASSCRLLPLLNRGRGDRSLHRAVTATGRFRPNTSGLDVLYDKSALHTVAMPQNY